MQTSDYVHRFTYKHLSLKKIVLFNENASHIIRIIFISRGFRKSATIIVYAGKKEHYSLIGIFKNL